MSFDTGVEDVAASELLRRTQDARYLAVLGTMFPSWHFELREPRCGGARWWAYRDGPISFRQWAAGVRPALGRTSADRLAGVLFAWTQIMLRLP
jgi:hypothetical protein